MGHEHEHGTAHYSRAFAIGVVLNQGLLSLNLRATGPLPGVGG
jgi:hypothetical protein